jgi:putative effector of murein hydrolase
MRRFVSLIGLILASILVGLVVMEVVLRLFGISYPNFTIANEWTGFSLRPGAAGGR